MSNASGIDFPLSHHAPMVITSTEVPLLDDFFAGDPSSLYVSMAEYQGVLFNLIKGAGAGGTATITVNSATDIAGTGADAIPFSYRVMSTNDTWGEWQQATDAGFTTAAGADDQYQIWVQSPGLDTVEVAGDAYVNVSFTEVVDLAVSASLTCILVTPRYAKDVPDSVIV